MTYSELSPEQQLLEDERFWADLDAELETDRLREFDYINTLTEEEYYKQYVLPNLLPEEDEVLGEPSIEVI